MAPETLNHSETNSSSETGSTKSIRDILAQHGRLSRDIQSLDEESDLYSAGLTSLATVGIMLALESHFDIEFPESMLKRGTFRSIASIAEAVTSLAS